MDIISEIDKIEDDLIALYERTDIDQFNKLVHELYKIKCKLLNGGIELKYGKRIKH